LSNDHRSASKLGWCLLLAASKDVFCWSFIVAYILVQN
jgi:hypothetical protein